ncbi:hypothetical protein CEE37_01355 [candidate division LCP-89 bacterium B3_LCP]|uniref:Secretion system C-terminal sorting domain-containing protein n=1 Tax=candidate division LCP-89 bacterium B3_LCP TaxID=2012998 RepID=A0A532V581_UNCL8|nr:MAG: hypothetical protein CEE37_01355 [candidate division LCP-89 bacterium B3_LCP]
MANRKDISMKPISMNKFCLALIALLCSYSLTFAQPYLVEDWEARYTSTYEDADRAVDCVVDDDGNVYVTGYTTSYSTLGNITTIKYDSYGIQQWIRTYNGSGDGFDRPADMTIGADGNIYITGYVTAQGPSYDHHNVITLKYSPVGSLLWHVEYTNPNAYQDTDEGVAIAADNSGNVYVAAKSDWESGPVYDYNYLVLKYSTDGLLLWTADYGTSGENWDMPTDICVDNFGCVCVTGYLDQAVIPGEHEYDYGTVKFSSLGVEMWDHVYNGPGDGDDKASAMYMNNSGQVYVTGWSQGSSSMDYATLKYSPLGTLYWTERFDGPGSPPDYAYDIAGDPSGNIIVTGESANSGNYRFQTVRYTSSGSLSYARWHEAGTSCSATEIVTDTDGNAYIAGTVETATAGSDYILIKYDNTGIRDFEVTYDGPASGDDVLAGLAVDGNDIYVTGYSEGIGTGADYATIKYQQSTYGLEVSLHPESSYITVPAAGGSFDFYVTLENYSTSTVPFDIWSLAEKPAGGFTNPLIGPLYVNIGPGVLFTSSDKTQNVPALAPTGTYKYWIYVGDYPSDIWDDDYFEITKLSYGDGAVIADWSCYGEPWFDEAKNVSTIPEVYEISGAHPNPFNPTTTITYTLPATANVNLSIYDIRGAVVTSLVDGYRQAGSHEITFNAASLPSGIYLARLESGGQTFVQKLILMK